MTIEQFNTVILSEVHVDAAMRVYHPSGVDFMDEAVGGRGFKRSQVVYLWGNPGAGKSTLIQMLADSFSKMDNFVVIYNGTEEAKEQMKIRIEELGLDGKFICSFETDPKQLTKLCDHVQATNPGKQLVLFVDSLQTLNDGKWGDKVNSKTPERCLGAIYNWVHGDEKQKIPGSGALVFVVGHGTKGDSHSGSEHLKHMTDTFGGLRIDRRPKSETFGMRLLQFVKNRRGGTSDPIVLDMDKSRNGLLFKVGQADESLSDV